MARSCFACSSRAGDVFFRKKTTSHADAESLLGAKWGGGPVISRRIEPAGWTVVRSVVDVRTVLDAIRAADIFATLVPEDTYKVASELHDLLVKTHQSDAGKIAEIKALLWEYLFIDRVLEVAEEARFD
jgi:hypothetical protein